MIIDQTFETGSIPPGSSHHIEELITIVIEILSSYINLIFIDPLNQPLIDPPSTRNYDAYYHYYLSLGSIPMRYFGMKSPSFHFPEGLGNSYFSTTPLVDIVGASSLSKTLVT
jgi:hypothetical protein